ncbi:MAG: hypothetical protein COC19_05640 [SAR86 cluster bacterium]|uniref:MSHA biogenesis protein MshJ n=1 Tax=SAR86 cluster bacterium TaxID=2030880 RepID=A0A2A4MKW0_9GAMM|nr:MAG: hypothetical protein COC19_05640 [SAR86 cluster bacterium]
MIEVLKQRTTALISAFEARPQAERVVMFIIGFGVLLTAYLSLAYDPMEITLSAKRNQINGLNQQTLAKQNEYLQLQAASEIDPNKVANERLTIVLRDQQQVDRAIEALAGDLVLPRAMTEVLTTVLDSQQGLELVGWRNISANPLRENLTNINETLATTGAVNFDEKSLVNVNGQVYEHGLEIEFEGDYFSTLRYLRFLENIEASFFWDSIHFTQLEWPKANVVLKIHTLSTSEGFIGV